VQVWSPRTGVRVPPASPGRRAVPVHAEEGSHLDADGKRPWCAAWCPWCRKAKVHLTSFHGVYAPHAALRPRVTMPPPPAPTSPSKETKKKARTTRRLDWAALHQHTFGVDVLRCPCGGRRRIHAIHSTRKTAFGAPASARPSTPLATHPPTHHRPALAGRRYFVSSAHIACSRAFIVRVGASRRRAPSRSSRSPARTTAGRAPRPRDRGPRGRRLRCSSRARRAARWWWPWPPRRHRR